MSSYTNPDCHFGDHLWMGGGVCVRCGLQLRCACGVFVREDGIDAHLERCRLATVGDHFLGAPR